jgi:2-haloacid dehalogenase
MWAKPGDPAVIGPERERGVKQLADFKILTFDTYGTLIDWETGILRALASLRRRATDPVTDEQLLEMYGEIEYQLEQQFPTLIYSGILAGVYREMAHRLRVAVTGNEATVFAQSIADWPAFPDTIASLNYLKRHFRIATLTNCDKKSYQGTDARLAVAWDAIYTAQEIGSYKPALANFRYMLERLKSDFGFEPSDVLHVAQSLTHDHVPATQLGIAKAWIDRRRGRESSGATIRPTARYVLEFEFASLAEMVEQHRQSLMTKGVRR